MDWFRLYHDMINDPKIVQFSPENRWFYVGFLCVSSKETPRGVLPSVEHLAISLRIRAAKVRSLIAMFKKAGLIDEDSTTKVLTVHGWESRQRRSDDANERQHRRRHPECHVTKSNKVTELSRDKTVPRVRAIDTETDTEKEIPPLPPRGGVGRESLEPFQPEGGPGESALTPQAVKVMDECGTRWGSGGGDVSADLLRTFRPDVVRYAADQTFNKFARSLTPAASAYWRRICQNHRDGPPAESSARAPSRPAPELKFTVGTNPDDLLPPSMRGKKHVDANGIGRAGAERPAPASKP